MHEPRTALGATSASELNPLEFAVMQSRVIFYIGELENKRKLNFISANVETVLGHKVEDVLADPDYWWRFIHPDDGPEFERILQNLAVAGSGTCEFRFTTATADEVWLRAELRLIPAQANGGDAYTACLHDITADKRAQRKLHEMQAEQRRLTQLLHDALESLPNGFSLSDAEGRLVLCNRAFAEPYGIDPQSLVGMSRPQRIRLFLPQMTQFDGIPVTGSPRDAERWADRLQSSLSNPIELELKNGQWKLVTRTTTSDGGRVTIRTDITQQKKAEIALRETEQLFSAFFDHAPIAMNFKDASGRFWMVNKQFSEWFGHSNAQVAGKTLTELYPHDYADLFVAFEQEVLKQKRPIRRELQVPFADGTPHPMAVVKFPVLDGEGRIMGVGSFHADISTHKQLENELRQSRAVLEDAIESLSEGFALFDAQDRLVMCNSRYREFFLHSSEVLVPGAKWLDLMRTYAERGEFLNSAEDIDRWLEATIARRQRLRRIRVDQMEIRHNDGRWFKTTAQQTQQGGMVIVREDITESRQMEQALRDSEALVRRVLEACPAFITMNRLRDGVIIYESPAVLDLLGFASPQIGQSLDARWVSERDRREFVRRLRDSGAVDGFEVRFRKADGVEFWCAISSRLIEYQGEEVVVNHLFDLSERRAAEAELAAQREMLHQSEKLSALGELLASVAHELNNPLSVVTGQALLLRETSNDTRIANRAAKIGNAADRCARIVKTFLAMARQQPRESKAVDLNTIVEASVEVTAYMLRSSGIAVRMDLAEEPPFVTGDADQLSQVIINLIVNAQQALEEISRPRQITLSTDCNRSRKQVILSIQDNGPGIAAAIRSRIFEPFFTTKEIGEGTGVGLALCHRIVTSHKGIIEVDSDIGRGTVFVIRLPIREEPPEQLPNGKVATGAVRELSVLVIDDEANNADLLAEILFDLGHSADTAYSGETALGKLAQRDFDIILSDLRMPGLDGPGLFRLLQQHRPELLARIAFITGDTLGVKARDFLHAAKRPYIEKPITPEDVESLLYRLIVGNDSDGAAVPGPER